MKKGMELSINFIVILILSLVIFMGGVALSMQFFSKAEDVSEKLSQDTKQELLNLLDDGSPVLVPVQRIEIERGGFAATAIGVYNTLGKQADFTLFVSEASSVSPSGGIGSIQVIEPSEQVDFSLANTEKRIFDVVFKASDSTPAGNYIFDIDVKVEDDNGVSYEYAGYTPKIIVVLK